MSKSGYTVCACRDCFDVTVSSDTGNPELCWGCLGAGCEATSNWQGMGTYSGAFFGCQREEDHDCEEAFREYARNGMINVNALSWDCEGCGEQYEMEYTWVEIAREILGAVHTG